MSDSVCAKCSGIEGCNRYCAIQAGKCLVDFINNIEVVQTKIGELREGSRTKEIKYIVSGHIVEKDYPLPTSILSDLDTRIDASGKFTQFDGYTPQQLITKYMETIEISPEAKSKTIEAFRLFNSNKLLPMSIKAGSECEVAYTNEAGKKIVSTTTVARVMWSVDRDTNKIKCTLVCEASKGAIDGATKYVKVPISEYGTSLKLPQLERTLKSSEIDRDFIRMNYLGLIKPIEISDGKVTIALDSQNMYRISDDSIIVIASWANGKLVEQKQSGITTIKKSDAYKKLMNCMAYIEKHRRFIVPYGLFEVNHIDIE